MKAGISFGIELHLISDDDECLEDLKKMSTGGDGMDELYAKGLYWSPGSDSADPTMPMGPSTLGLPSSSSSYYGGGGGSSISTSNSWTSNKEGASYYYKRRSSSARAFKQSWTMVITLTIAGAFGCFFLSWI